MGGGGEFGFNKLFLKEVLFYFVEMFSPLSTMSFCDTFKSQQRKWGLREITMKSEDKLSLFKKSSPSPLPPPQVFKALSFHCLYKEQRFNINEILICVYFYIFNLIQVF